MSKKQSTRNRYKQRCKQCVKLSETITSYTHEMWVRYESGYPAIGKLLVLIAELQGEVITAYKRIDKTL